MAYTLGDGYEPELMHLRRWVHPNDVVIDVGAHYGVFTIPLATLAAKVHAIEPSRHARDVLKKNIDLNDLTNVVVHPFAVGASDASAILHHHDDPSRASLNPFGDGAAAGEDVQIRRIDDLVDGLVSLIKMDVEGFELPALQGAARILSEYHPTVLFEQLPSVTRRSGSDPYGAWHFLEAMGYRFEQLRPDGSAQHLQNPQDAVATNVIAIHD